MKLNSFLIFKLLLVFLLLPAVNLFVQADAIVNPKYANQTITVGGPEADIPGYTSESIQIALDAIKTRGGGTVELNRGIFDMSGPVRIYNNTSLTGSGEKTILRKCDGFRTNLIVDADRMMIKATVKDVIGFKVGMGIQLFDDSHKSGFGVTAGKITDISGSTIYFDKNMVYSYKTNRNGTVSNGCSIVEAIEAENVEIKNLVVEGNKSANDYINGCVGGGIYLFKTRNCLVEGVKVNEFNGDSFSWQITENIIVRNCEASNGGGLGFHPGTGSDHSIIENCVTHHNRLDGIFLCFRVQNGIFKNNKSYANGRFGISIGHKDTDNIFENNNIYENAQHGINFRSETELNSGHRNIFKNNTIENNGMSEKSYGFYIGGTTHDVTIENNIIRSTGKGNQAAAVCIGKNSTGITLRNNNISGHEKVIQE